jgi:6-phosphogluconolactonase
MNTKLLLSFFILFAAIPAPAAERIALLGTYTGDSRGIYTVRLNTETGELSVPELAAEISNPEFLALHPNGRVVYTVTRVTGEDGKVLGAVASFALDPVTGKLTLLNVQSTGQGQLCHIAVDATGRMVIVASYGGGYVASFPLEADGRVGPLASLLPHSGPLGPKTDRQNAPHVHSVTISPDNRCAFVADLGLDRVLAYRLEPETGRVTPHDPAFATVAPGAGPRHTKFSPDGKSFYILNELNGTVTACRYDAARGALDPFQTLSTLPEGYTGRQSASEIRMHPSSRFVYSANRVHNSLAVFARNTDTGVLTLVENVPTGGDQPRNFNLTPDGAWLVCANQATDNLIVFKVDAATGRLAPTGRTTKLPKTVCVLFLP